MSMSNRLDFVEVELVSSCSFLDVIVSSTLISVSEIFRDSMELVPFMLKVLSSAAVGEQ